MADQREQRERKPYNEQGHLRRALYWIKDHYPDSNTMVAVATILLVVVGAWGIVEGKKALELTQRAWVVPIAANLVGLPEAGKAFHFIILFINTGREPALNVETKFTTAIIDAFDPQTVDMRDIKITAANPCSGLNTIPGRIFAPTSSTLATGYTYDTARTIPQIYPDDKIMSGNHFVVIRGCVAYTTYEQTHKTSFCYVLESASTPAPSAPPAPQGNASGNTVTGAGKQWRFEGCATGFEAD